MVEIASQPEASAGAGQAEPWPDHSVIPPVWSRITNIEVGASGEGTWLITPGGERYLDYSSGIGVTRHRPRPPGRRGHRGPGHEAASTASRTSSTTSPGWRLHERLPHVLPRRRWQAFLSNSGARRSRPRSSWPRSRTRRPLVVGFRGGFHGRTHGTMALTSQRRAHRGHYEPLLGGVHHVPSRTATGRRGGSRSAHRSATAGRSSTELFATLFYPDDVAAFVVEPILGEGGYVVPADGLPARAAGAGRPARHPADRRRGPDRLRPDGPLLRLGVDRRRGPTSWSWPRALPRDCRCRGIMARRSLIEPSSRPAPTAERTAASVSLRRGPGDARRDRGGGPRRQRGGTRAPSCWPACGSWPAATRRR